MDPKVMQRMMMESMYSGMRVAFDSMNSMQDQLERMWKMLLEQGGSIQKEGEKAFLEWMENMRKGREEFRRSLEEGIRKLEELMAEGA
jgi:hypothetical protein